jgi:adhesin HecA-like repeat protein
LDNSGTIGADQRVKLTIAKTLDNSGTIQSNGRVDAVADKLMNRGTITSLKEMNLTGSNLLRNNQGGLIQSKGTLTLNGTILSNAGRLAGHATVILANNITNAVGGEILSQTTLMCDGDNLSNSGVISSKKSMLVKLHNSFTNQGYILGHGLEFQVNNKFLNTYAIQQDGSKRRGEILSSGSILIKGRTQAKTQFVENHSSLIQATGGGIHIHADQFRNYRNPAKIIWKEIGNSSWIQKWQMIESQDDAAEILANGKITINAVTALNEYSLISGVGDIHMVGTKLENTAQHLIEEFYRWQDPPSKKKRRGGVRGALGSTKTVTSGDGGFVLSRTQVRETIPARIEAGGKFTGSFTDRLRQADSGIKENTAPEINPQTMRAHHVPNLEKLAQQAAASPLFQTAPADSPYFIETHPDFVDLGKYAGSPHFRARTEPYRGRPDAPKLYGDSFVMQREIMRQIHDLTGSHLLGTNLTSDQLIELLFTQGDEAEKDLALTPEITLTKDQVARLRRSIIRFEKRTINGVDILYPQVYLSAQDLMKLAGKGASIAAMETLIQAPTVENSGTIEGFVKNQLKADHLFQQGGVIDGGETTVTVDDLVNLSGVIAGDTTTVRAGQVHSETLVKTHAHAHGYTGEAQRRAAFIARKGKLDIDVTGDYTAIGTQHSGAGGIDLEIGGQRHLDAAEVSSHFHSSNRRGSHTQGSVRNVKTTFDSGTGTDISIHSVGAAFDRGIDIAAGRHISKTSDSKTLDQAVVDSDYRETTYQKKSGGKKRIQKSSHQSARVNRNRYTGSGDLDLHSRDDHTLGPIYAKMGQKARVSSEVGTMHMAGQKSSEAESSEKKSEDKFWKSTSSYGHVDEHLEQSQIHAAGGTEITGGKGVVIDRAREKHSHANGKKHKGKPRTHEHLRDDSTVAGQEWMKTPGATFNTVDELHQSWEFRNQGMTAAAKVVVTLLVMIATSGAGSFFAGGGAAGAGAGGAATAASTSVSIGQAVTQFATQAATSLGFSASMAANIGAGVSAMACAGMAKAVVAGIDNRGNIVNTTKDLATKEQALDLLATGVTAGATRGIGAKLGVDKMRGMSGIAARAGVKAGVRSTVRMASGEKPKAVLRQGAGDFVAQVGAEVGAGYIGGLRADQLNEHGDNPLFYTLHKAAHFGNAFATEYAGSTIGGIKGEERTWRSMSAGIGASTGEVYAEHRGFSGVQNGTIDPNNPIHQERLIQESQAVASVVAGLSGYDASIAGNASASAVENNNLGNLIKFGAQLLTRKAANEAGKQVAKEAVKEVVKAETKEVAKEAVKETTKSASKEIAKNLKPAKLDKTRVANGNKRPHGNSLNYKGDTHVYSIHRFSDKRAIKVGESTRGVRVSDGASKRAESQARKLNRETGDMYYTRIRRNFANKSEAKRYEADLIKRSRDINGSKSLPLNKNGH